MMENTTTTDSNGQSLVTSPISQTDTLEIYPVSLRVKRPNSGNNPEPPDRTATQIVTFSAKSRSRLRFAAVNAYPKLISQLGLTYHNEWPTDGRTCKAHLNLFLTHLRNLLPGISYLWIMEFQKRKAPHFHLFLSTPPSATTRHSLAVAWTRITSPFDQAALDFHDNPKNWISWEMNNANYLAKYLDKDAQKCIPANYFNFGRFWGNSRNLVKDPITFPITALANLESYDQITGEIDGGETKIIRALGRLAEKQTNGYSKFRIRAPRGSYTILNGTQAYKQLERYYRRLKHEKD